MNHPAELAIHSFLQNVMLGKASMNKATINRVAKDVKDALGRQFSGRGKKDFRLRMSNIGRKKCQLWLCVTACGLRKGKRCSCWWMVGS